jgi:hypothetical protein
MGDAGLFTGGRTMPSARCPPGRPQPRRRTRGTVATLAAVAILVAFAIVGGAPLVSIASSQHQYQYQYGLPPTVLTDTASNVTRTSATLNALVDPNGESVSACHFDWGTTPAYGHMVSCLSLPGSGQSLVAVSAVLGGLVKATTYHFRIVATNPSGTSYGSDKTFSTLTQPPAVHKISPASGSRKGGTPVTITGQRFLEASAVYFGKAPATGVHVISQKMITVVSPKGKHGTVDVTVATPSGLSPIAPSDRFTYE